MRAALTLNGLGSSLRVTSVTRHFYQRRRHIRYPIRIPVSVQWLAPRGQKGSGKARTKDISEGGAFVFSRTLPPLGAIVELKVHLPPKQAGAASSRLEMQGEVLRVDTPSGRESLWGFAIYATKTAIFGPKDSPVLGKDKEE